MADHSVIIWDGLHESEVSQSLMLCVDNPSPENSCFVVDLFCFILLRLRLCFLCFRMQQEGIEIFHYSPPRENSGSTQFVVTRKRGSQWLRELTFVCYVSGRRSQKKLLKYMLMWCLVVFQHDSHGQYLPQAKEELFLSDILCRKGRRYLRLHPLAQNHTKQIRQCNNQANEL